MKLSLDGKKAVVAEVNQAAMRAISAVVADYRGLTSQQMTRLRSEARKNGVYLKVARNTLTRRAFEQTEFSCLNEYLVGPLFIALSMDAPSDAARLLKDHLKSFDKLQVKALAIGGKVHGPDQLEAIASLPTKDEAIAKLMYVLKAPVEKFVRTLAAPNLKMVRTVVAVKDAKSNH